jgi:hypothetical protein
MDDDSSNSESDNEELYVGDPEDNIVFFPTAVIELKYRVIKRLESMEEINQARDRIQILDTEVEARNDVFKRQREEHEREEMIEQCKNMDYSGFLAQRSTSGTS